MCKKWINGLLLCICIVSISGCSSGTGGSTTNENHFVINNEYDCINVSGSSVKKVEPDVAKITFTVRTEASTPEESQSKNTEDMNAVLAKLKELGVADNKIKTYNYNMYPRYDYIYDSEANRDGERVLVGYTVTNTLEVSGLAVGSVGNILTECVQVGINDIDGIEYTYSKYDETYNEVLNDAVKVARIKADSIASSNEVTVGSIKKITEGRQDTSYRYTNSVADMGVAKSMMAEAESFDIMSGEIEIKANVDVTFEISK